MSVMYYLVLGHLKTQTIYTDIVFLKGETTNFTVINIVVEQSGAKQI